MTFRRLGATIALVVGASLTLAACGSTPSRTPKPAAVVSTPAHPPATAAPAATGCPPQPPRHAWAVDVTTAGRIVWQTPLATRNLGFSAAVAPLIDGPVTVLDQDGIVHGLDLSDGHPLWSWTGGPLLAGMWRWDGLVAVLAGQVSRSSLTGLDAATGAVRWSLRLPGRGPLGGLAATADGGLAMMTTNGILQVVNLADGAVRWHRAVGASPVLTAAGQLVVSGVNGRLTGYDDRTGQPRWTTGGLPEQSAIQLAAGLVLVTSDTQGPGITTALTAVVPGTGRVAWRFDPGTPVTVLSAGPAGLTVATYDPRRLYLLDPRTGRPRWHADTFVVQDSVPLVTATDVLGFEGPLTGVEGQPAVDVVDRAAATGVVRWQDTLTGPFPGGWQVLAVPGSGPLAVVQGEPSRAGDPAPLLAYQLSSGRAAWRVDMPAFVQAPPVLAPGSVLVQPADPTLACAAAG